MPKIAGHNGDVDLAQLVEKLNSPPTPEPLVSQQTMPRNCSSTSEVKDEVLSPSPAEMPVPVAFDTTTFDGFDIKEPVELLVLLDEAIAKGKENGGVDLHPWQIQFLLDFANGGQTDMAPFQSVVRACNGSGKDKYIIAPCVVWLCMRYRKARGIITSSSGVQLDNQTNAYIEQLCKKANQLFGNVWKINYRYYECLPTESPIVLFATDEAGKAEGYHPLEPGAKMGLFESEAKTVSDDINVAMNKCTGYTHRVLVSTPGNIIGHFYEYCQASVNRKEIKTLAELLPTDWLEYHVTAFDCPHLSKSYIEQMKRDLPGHENGSAYKSQVLAEFGTTDEMVVIPSSFVRNAVRTPPEWIKEPYNKAGLDLSDGGDETVLSVRNGNKLLTVIPFRFDNTEDTVAFLNTKFNEWELTNEQAHIHADMGGLGKPILDRMKRQGWTNIRYCDNRSASSRPKTYKNKGSEMYFHLRLLLERREIILTDDPSNILSTQLSTRYYKIKDGAIHQLLSKQESRARGYKSPDRADSVVLCFNDYKSTYTEKVIVERPYESKSWDEKQKEAVVPDFDFRVWAATPQSPIPMPEKRSTEQYDLDDIREAVSAYNTNLKLTPTKRMN